MKAAKPDLIIGVGNDHLLNLPLKNPPHWRVDCAPEWNGPAEFFKSWLKQPGYHVKGRPDVAEAVVREATKAGIKIDRGEGLLFDDNWSVPLWYLGYDVPILPIHMNCINPPVPTPEECIAFDVGAISSVVRRSDVGEHRHLQSFLLDAGTGSVLGRLASLALRGWYENRAVD